MDIPNNARDVPRKSRTIDSYQAVDLFGGDPLEGSGFEAQTTEPGFQFNWSPLTDRSEGGVR
jgi:hypothetical protein